MKFLDKLISFIFDLAIIIIAFTVILVMTNMVKLEVVNGILNEYVFNFEYQTIIISIAAIVILAALKITVFSSSLSSVAKKNIFVNTPHGKIQIAQETIENIAKNVVREHPSIRDVQARMTKAGKGINMYTVLLVNQNTNIKDVVTKVQDGIKKQIEETTSVKVKNVDVKIRNVIKPSANVEKQITKNEDAQIVNIKKEANTVVAGKVETVKEVKKDTQNKEEYISKPATGEYMKDENDVLYKIEPNPNSKGNEEE